MVPNIKVQNVGVDVVNVTARGVLKLEHYSFQNNL